MADPTKVHQVIMNLCTNAGYAMRDKGGVLTIRLSDIKINKTNMPKPNMDIGFYLHFTVEDTGGGIPNETLERIFDPFFTTKPGGTGLGLSIVQRIVQNHDGDVQITSNPGRGTIVSIWLPEYRPTKGEGG